MRRRLKIAWSVFFTLLTVALCVLWVRSYWWLDGVTRGVPDGAGYKLISLKGELGLWRYSSHIGATIVGWHRGVMPAADLSALSAREMLPGVIVISYVRPIVKTNWPYAVIAPHSFLIGLFATIGVSPWLSWFKLRFSLRSMLIATTLVAVVLGIVAYAMR
jgi:hypothetical protein